MADTSQNDQSDHPSTRNPFRNALKNFRKFLIPLKPVVSPPAEQWSPDKSREQQLADIQEQQSLSHEQSSEIKPKELSDDEGVGGSSSEDDVFGFIRSRSRRFSRRFSSVFEGFAHWSVDRPAEQIEPAEPAEPPIPAEPSKEQPITRRGRFRAHVRRLLDNIRNLNFGTRYGQSPGEDTIHLLTPEHEADKAKAKPKEIVDEKPKRKITDSDYPILEAKVSVSTFSSSEGPTEMEDI